MGKWVEQLDQVIRIGVADRSAANRLDEIEGGGPGLVGDDVAERASEQADVVVERRRRAHRSRIGAEGATVGLHHAATVST